jgi:hypothetical protein
MWTHSVKSRQSWLKSVSKIVQLYAVNKRGCFKIGPMKWSMANDSRCVIGLYTRSEPGFYGLVCVRIYHWICPMLVIKAINGSAGFLHDWDTCFPATWNVKTTDSKAWRIELKLSERTQSSTCSSKRYGILSVRAHCLSSTLRDHHINKK